MQRKIFVEQLSLITYFEFILDYYFGELQHSYSEYSFLRTLRHNFIVFLYLANPKCDINLISHQVTCSCSSFFFFSLGQLTFKQSLGQIKVLAVFPYCGYQYVESFHSEDSGLHLAQENVSFHFFFCFSLLPSSYWNIF